MDQTDNAPGQDDDMDLAQGDESPEEMDDARGNVKSSERGAGNQAERNPSGISNRGMSEAEEQADLPSRGSGDQDSDR